MIGATSSRPAFEAILGLLRARTGLFFGPSRRDGAEAEIRRAMERAKACDMAAYLARIEADEDAFSDLVSELTIGETYFFRDPGQFDFIRREVLPGLRAQRGAGFSVRAWCAGCASGEEPFSLAILFEEEGVPRTSRILATDISRAAIAKALRATYGPWAVRGAEERLVAHARRAGRDLVLKDRVRARVFFDVLNLALDAYPSLVTGTWGLDLILCRNVLIYFDRETIAAVARRLFLCLAEGGWLVLGPSDPPLGDFAPFEAVLAPEGVFYRRKAARANDGISDERAGLLARRDIVEDAGERPALSALAASRGGGGPLSPPRAKDDPAAALRIREIANLCGSAEAERAAAEASLRYPLSAELHFLRAVLLMDLGRDEEAADEARRAIYLDRSLAVCHFVLGTILGRRGDREGARRAYRNARRLCAGRPPGEPVPLSDGEQAGRLAEAAAAHLALLEASGGAP